MIAALWLTAWVVGFAIFVWRYAQAESGTGLRPRLVITVKPATSGLKSDRGKL